MKPFTTLTSIAAPMPDADIDTDIVFPARFLLLTEKSGLGRYAFFDKRFLGDGRERADFVLHRAPWRAAAMLVAGPNFGCGSSREQAAWALADLGVRCIVAPSFGEIFQANCIANGMLPVVLKGADHARVMAEAEAARAMHVDLMGCTIELADGTAIGFALPERQRRALLAGLDDIALIAHDEGRRIDAYEQAQRLRMPWLFAAESGTPPTPLTPA
jgi:3-isopropylmalate dehydratase small subunit